MGSNPGTLGLLTLADRAGGDTRCRVLVAEDNPVNQMLVLTMLRKLGCEADGVTDGQFAIEALSVRWYDLVLMDCEMPRMDGFEATRRIRRMSGHSGRHLPIAALTASTHRDACARCMDAGMNDYLTKPLSLSRLADTLARWVGLPAQ